MLCVADEVKELCPLKLTINVPPHGDHEVNQALDAVPPESDVGLLFAENSSISSSFCLRGPGDVNVVVVNRKTEEPFDMFRIEDGWWNHLSEQQRKQITKLTIKLTSLCRKYLKDPELDASLLGDPSTAWANIGMRKQEC